MVDLVILIIFDYWREKSPSDNREKRLNIQDRAGFFFLENWGPYPNFGRQKGDVKEAPYWGPHSWNDLWASFNLALSASCTSADTVQFPYLETWWARKWG